MSEWKFASHVRLGRESEQDRERKNPWKMSEASIKLYEQKFLCINPLIDMKDWPHLLFKHCKHNNERTNKRASDWLKNNLAERNELCLLNSLLWITNGSF